MRGFGAAYWKLWSASVVSNLGDGISRVAYPWLAGTLTRDPVLIAGATVAVSLPWLLVSLPAGAIVDRTDRRKLMVGADVLRCALTALVAVAVLTDTMTIPVLYAAALLIGCAEVLHDNAAQTILPSIVSAERLERANGNLWSAEILVGQFLGPPLGGLLIGVGLAVPFLFDAGSFGVAAGLVFLIAGTFRPAAAAPVARRSLRAEIAEGFRWLWNHRLLRSLCLFLGAMNAMTTAAWATQVLFAQEILDLDARGFGLLLTAEALGGVLGGQLASRISRRIGPGTSLFVVLAGDGLALGLAGLTSTPLVFAALTAVGSFLALLWNVITVSLRQTIIPDHLLGRVNSVYRFFGWGMMPLGGLLGGGLVVLGTNLAGREAGLRLPLLVAGAAHLVMFVLALRELSTARIEAAKQEAVRT